MKHLLIHVLPTDEAQQQSLLQTQRAYQEDELVLCRRLAGSGLVNNLPTYRHRLNLLEGLIVEFQR